MNNLRTRADLSLVGLSIVCTLLLTGCGSSKGSGGDPVAVCKKGCTKYLSLCLPDAGDAGELAKGICESSCMNSMPTGTTCTNSNAIITAYNACLAKTTCDELTTCTSSIPPCAGGGTGTGGSSGAGTGGSSGAGTGGRSGGGTGGSTGGGTGGSTGGGTGGSTGTGATCADVLACCNASTNAQIKAACMAQYSAIMTAGDAVCAMYLTPQVKAAICP